MGHSKQCFWSVGGVPATKGDITAAYRKNMADAASEVQTANEATVIMAVSSGGLDISQGPEITLLIDISNHLESSDFNSLLNTLTTSIENKLTDAFSSADPSVTPTAALQKTVRFEQLGGATKTTADAHKASFNIQSARMLHESLFLSPRVGADPSSDQLGIEHPTNASMHVYSRSSKVTASSTSSTSSTLATFSVTADVYKTLSSLTSTNLCEIKTQLNGLQKAFDELAKESVVGGVVRIMALNNIVTIGPKMQAVYDSLSDTTPSGPLPSLISYMITECGGLATIHDAIKSISDGIGRVWGDSSDALNLMLFINGQQHTFDFDSESILHGEKRVRVGTIPKPPATLTKKLKAYPCAFLAFQKATEFGTDFSYYGSSAGFTLESGSKKFSIGLCSPSTVLGGDNAVRLLDGSHDAAKAAKAADDAASTTGSTRTGEELTINGGKCTVNRASDGGNLNLSVCVATP